MKMNHIETFFYILMMSSMSFAAIELKPEKAALSSKHFYSYMNTMPDEDRLESWPMGDYNLFVNMATWSVESQKIQNALNDFAKRHHKSIAVVLVYDNVSQNLNHLKMTAESTPVREFFDRERRMYHLFKRHERDPSKFRPSFVFVNPKGEVLFNDYLEDLRDLETFADAAQTQP